MSALKPKGVGLTRGRLALISVLSSVLMYVLKPLVMPEKPTASARPAPRATASSPNNTETTDTADPMTDWPPRRWPDTPLDKAAAHDPFHSPHVAAALGATRVGALAGGGQGDPAEELQGADSTVLLISGGESVARIGDEEYRVGDLFAGREITAITPRGLVFEPQD
ncbi:hypothetical protein Mal64_24090 [Pseudobythopirellula maris]|uniref:Uncharacterized protein n=1 Tax=Pseudobythopirellula maris TaxID=2527991 RepID=A0A5C5ZN93_9BACT|nr:hypothetical protein [Pseudobythopirellula maris]TWT88919.1 hypothetical protein Mal64_24090 [Pseudobythopirellula maris]